MIAGFSVQRIQDASPREDIETVVEHQLRQAGALICISTDAAIIQVFYRTRDGGKVYVELPFPEDEESRLLTALHIADLLRVVLPDNRTTSIVPEPLPVSVPARRPSDALTGFLDAAVVWPDLTAPPQAGVMPGIGLRMHRWLSVQLTGMLPVYPMRLAETEGEARVFLFGAGAFADMTPGTRRVRPLIRAGWMLWISHARTAPSASWEGLDDTAVLTGPAALLGVSIRLRNRLGLESGAMMSYTLSHVRYEADNRHIATAGQPMLGATLGIALLPKEHP
jgi:hypothetical protein